MNEEMLQCALYNFGNVERAVPMLKQHPFWIIAMAQFKEGMGESTVEAELEKHEIPHTPKVTKE